MKLRMAVPADAEKIIAWSEANKEKSHFDAETLAYPLTEVLCAENGRATLFLPVQLVGMIEALAPNPESSERERSKALYLTLGALVSGAREQKVKELYFVGTDPELNTVAESAGFEELPWPVFRKRI